MGYDGTEVGTSKEEEIIVIADDDNEDGGVVFNADMGGDWEDGVEKDDFGLDAALKTRDDDLLQALSGLGSALDEDMSRSAEIGALNEVLSMENNANMGSFVAEKDFAGCQYEEIMNSNGGVLNIDLNEDVITPEIKKGGGPTLNSNNDDLEIVKESWSNRSQADVVDVDAEDVAADAEVDLCGASSDPTRIVGRKRRLEDSIYTPVGNDGLEIVRVGPRTEKETDAIVVEEVSCSCCAKNVSNDLERTQLARCRHVLCGQCGVKAVVDHAYKVRILGICPVAKCGAPLSRKEREQVLAPIAADDTLGTAYAKFEVTADATVNEIRIKEPSKEAVKQWTFCGEDVEESRREGEPWLHDDLETAFAALYKQGKGQKLKKRTVCIACGEVVESDYPTGCLPHCALGRAIGLKAAIKRLKEAVAAQDKVCTAPRKKLRCSKTRTGSSVSLNFGTPPPDINFFSKAHARGTGFGGGRHGGWKGNSVTVKKRTAKSDARVAYWLAQIRCLILQTELQRAYQDTWVRTWPLFMRLLLRKSGLIEVLLSILINDSIMDVGERIGVYLAALRVVSAITDIPSLRVLATEKGPDGRSLAQIVESLNKQAALLTSGVGDDVLPRNSRLLVKQVRRNIRHVNRSRLLQESKRAALDNKQGESSDQIEDETTKRRKELEAIYVSEMKKVQFSSVPGLHRCSVFARNQETETSLAVGQGKRMRRIATEVASLSTTLPLYFGSTILLRVDEERYDYLKACIFGPEGTPYAHGAFLFDIFLPPDYPHVPPKFHLLTTGGGRARFNPNLYPCGKVCLSLLGTWSGPGWTKASTLLQVLVSIQSLIMVAEPYFNEPGFERSIGTSHGKHASESYNVNVRVNNMRYAMLENIRNPPSEFVHAIRTHFLLRRDVIKKDVFEWLHRHQLISMPGVPTNSLPGVPLASEPLNKTMTYEPLLYVPEIPFSTKAQGGDCAAELIKALDML